MKKRDLLYESAVILFGEPANKPERDRINAALSLLREADVDHDELPLLALAYRAKFTGAAYTLMAVANRPGELRHWLANRPPSGEEVARSLEWQRQMQAERFGAVDTQPELPDGS